MCNRYGLILIVVAALLATRQAANADEPAGKATGNGCVAIAIGQPKPDQRCLVPGSGATDWFKDCPVCPEMVVVPAGSFAMGEDKPGQLPNDTPLRWTFAKPFAVGRFAVTFAEWDACVDDGGCNGYRPADQDWGRGNRPVINVNWDDATVYTKWLARKTGKPYRLLSEAEREYVARAGTTTPFWWGASIDLDRANYDVPVPSRRMPGVDYSEIRKLRRMTVPVDSFAANPWGLYNVHGNVWDWTIDCWREQGPLLVAPRRDANAAACGERVARGGSWNDFAAQARAGARIGFNATARNALQGFRVMRILP